ncbi:glutamine--fructose-6-phosphate transaminase (isomerizing) [Andreprevotia chitinilytica]|uniref:glutamine--fructose-6-phosphate transaminase (isomerizing) n=1 Tax=Andreprevotia chitinilytica TaxID=396808 RepID=UPI00055562CD|nr:glutamine--fructose-6-phosphate transaminase (isomerizing) [Andreprevotia chitinilytica]
MSHLIGLISASNTLPTLYHQIEQLDAFGFRGVVALHGGQDGLSETSVAGLPAGIVDAIGDTPTNRVLLRLDWGDPAQHAMRVCRDLIGVVMRGSLQNSTSLANRLQSLGYTADAKNPTELISALIHWYHRTQRDLTRATQSAVQELVGLFAISVIERDNPGEIVVATSGIPILIASHQNGFAFSDQLSPLLPFARDLIRLIPGEVASITPTQVQIIDASGSPTRRNPEPISPRNERAALDRFGHFMGKEIHEQPALLADTLTRNGLTPSLAELLGDEGARLLANIDAVVIVASGSSYHAALTARYWLEGVAGLPTSVELASEYRYLDGVVPNNTLAIGVSQSGETADTLAALRHAEYLGASVTLGVSNVRDSKLMQLAKLQLANEVGPEIAVTSTKTFTAQLLSMYQLSLGLAQQRGRLTGAALEEATRLLSLLPRAALGVLALEPVLDQWAQRLARSTHLFCVGRHSNYPIAREGALKMQEVAYLHAEGHPGGELKHGPLALVDADLPVVACLPWNPLAEKLLANLQEVRARHGELFVLSDAGLAAADRLNVARMPEDLRELNPILYAIALQLLAYRIAVCKGNEIDAPRHLAKAFATEQ